MSELITSTKIHLKRLLPNAKDISIKLMRDHEFYLSKIQAHLPGTVFYAEKRAQTPCEALESSCDAVLKQVEKFKSKRLINKRLMKSQRHELLSSPPP